ncbi:alpha-E domain-containing protein [Deinococcus sp. KNUC1210]|uniref:alpha-E domain-containing protein n=1 Tax=Deinococcus sp. KNUC1210 TaxID=2917691 RepID=UPI001EF04627|nr:alpha-E domain-containing protein [Deinococcus sp. KNUC1210]ULH15341.1 alpha-E domain-containing protein [Deinococcus sp. KNUC1210]
MLSRVAESLFWIGRYVERAENTARMLDVNYYATLEAAGLVSEQWGPLLSITGSEHSFREARGRVDARNVPTWLAFDRGNPGSITASIAHARENARGLRDRIPSEMWEALNRAYLNLCSKDEGVLDRDELHEYCVAAREASHLFFGIAFATLPRDEGWQFLRAGQILERGDNTLRLLQVRYRQKAGDLPQVAVHNHRWVAVLKSASAYEAYQKRRHAGLDPRAIAEFLLLDADFPRSVRHSAKNLHETLEQIERTRPEAHALLMREAAWLYARLQHASVDDILTDEDPGLDDLLSDFNDLGRQIHQAYFVV